MEYKKISGLPPNRDYSVNSIGLVKNNKTNHVVKTSITNSGYERIILGSKHNNKVVWRYIHRLVAEAFIGKIKDKQINHKDGNRLNNTLDNLEICTSSENHKHAHMFLGRKVHNISTTKEIADEIRKQVRKGKTQKSMADKYKLSKMVVSRICRFIQKEYL